MTGDDILSAIAAASPLTNPRLSELDWEAVAKALPPPDVTVGMVVAFEAGQRDAALASSQPDAATARLIREQRDRAWANLDMVHDDIAAMLEASGLGDHARPISTHAVVQAELLPWIKSRAGAPSPDLRAALHRIIAIAEDGYHNHSFSRPAGTFFAAIADEARALIRAAPAPQALDALDVDRLAQAMSVVWPTFRGYTVRSWEDESDPARQFLMGYAARLVAEYAALASEREGSTKPERLDVELRGDGPCRDCGTLDNIVWFTDNVFWNAVTGENVVHEESRGAILCVACFVQRTATAGFHPTGWRLLPDWPWRDVASSPSTPRSTKP